MNIQQCLSDVTISDFGRDMSLLVIGGLFTMVGGFIGIWFQSIFAHKKRFQEKLGEKKVEVYQKALDYADSLKSLVSMGTEDDILSYMDERNNWFYENLIFLSQKYENNWKSIKLNLISLKRLNQNTDRNEEKIEKTEKLLGDLAEEMSDLIRKELRRSKVKIIRPK